MKLSNSYLDGLKKREHKYCSSAERGLHLVIYPSGVKMWRFRYQIDGMRRHHSFGEYPHLSIDEAIDAAAALRGKVRHGIDPAEELREQKRQRSLDRLQRYSFGDLVTNYVDDAKRDGMKSIAERRKVLKREFGQWSSLRVQDITRTMIRQCLVSIHKRGPVARNRAHAYLRAMLSYAVECEIIETNPASGLSQVKEKSRHRHLTAEETKWFWRSVDHAPMTRLKQLALKLILVTGQRPGEVASMRVAEISGDWWTIPDTKNGEEQRVYLTNTARDIVEEARENSQSRKFVFGASKINHVEAHALPTAVRKWRNAESFTIKPFTPHDLRRTMGTALGRLKIPRLVQDKILNHVDRSIGGVYDRHSYDDQKREAWEKWEAELLGAVLAIEGEAV